MRPLLLQSPILPAFSNAPNVPSPVLGALAGPARRPPWRTPKRFAQDEHLRPAGRRGKLPVQASGLHCDCPRCSRAGRPQAGRRPSRSLSVGGTSGLHGASPIGLPLSRIGKKGLKSSCSVRSDNHGAKGVAVSTGVPSYAAAPRPVLASAAV